ncbi:hypothetical protein LVJ82_17285 [Vitreoscilla massiliensis]|uniref:Uncharacterized protein n=1 Tax=Vitreoscilla massiliensis TaxID=1689272 RepID=A0ABY4E115_9NEIS|nr:hypothetical protein [Vitreoscilla massiliensis]UOO89174.1 hypothetical protein LVJ82_17285 [Vitreoscilla massiliensis]
MSWINSLVSAGIEVLSKQFTLTSNWGGLNSQLICTIAPCDKNGAVIGAGVSAPFLDANLQQQMNWSSPFENITPESQSPTLAAALQSGMIAQTVESLSAAASGGDEAKSGFMSKLSEFLQQGEGRTGITKLNSTQVFTGNEPLKFDGTLAFRAYADPLSEVTQPITALWKMAMPKSLADGDTIANNAVNVAQMATGWVTGNTSSSDINTIVKAIFPSEAPGYVALQYRGKTYAPMVIESISQPLVNPTSALGDVYATVQISLGTHRSWDAKDIENSGQSALGRLVSDTVSAVSSLFK